MFKVEVLCEDKKLPRLMWAMVGLVADHPKVTPLRGGTVINGQAHETEDVPNTEETTPKFPRTGKLGPNTYDWLIEHKVATFDAASLREVIKGVGGNPNSFYYVIKWLRKNNKITGPDQDNVYKLKQTKEARRETPSNSLPFRTKVKLAAENSRLAESLAGKAAARLIGEGQTTVPPEVLRRAVIAEGGSASSDYYATIYLQLAGVLSPKQPDGTYKLDTEAFNQRIAADEAKE